MTGPPAHAPAFFVGVLPPPALTQEVLAWQRRLGHTITAPHVTLKAPATLTDTQQAACERVCRGAFPFEVRVGGVQTFPDRVIYLTAEGGGLHALHAALVAAVGLPPGPYELGGYHPHLTLAVGWRPLHFADQHGWAGVLVSARTAFAALGEGPLTFTAREAVLFRKARAGEPYHEAARWPLRGEGPVSRPG